MEKSEKASVVLSVLRTGGVLLVIATVIALLLSTVNGFTEPMIKENEKKEKLKAINEIFPDADDSTLSSYTDADTRELYTVLQGGTPIGYCCVVSGDGFADKIQMMVGISTDLTVKSIRILSISDTPGIGLKVNTPEFLDRFTSAGGVVKYGDGIDAISGATYSSNGVIEGVNTAIAACTAFSAGEGGAAQ